ncbi:MAG: carbonic anhydrase family protein [Xanthomonadales bacterium]|jgi:carbonic anhydrase|nr:carbonic anhydrase family protein [Xanthomonadales bacterium]
MNKWFPVAAMASALVLSANVFADGHSSVDETAITTPDEAIQALKDGNLRFVSGDVLNQDFKAQIEATSGGQQPFAGILSCLDSRVPPEIIFDQGIGDVFVGRVAGNIEDTNMIGSFEFAGELVGVKLLVVMGHTACGAVAGACAGAELGNLTALLAEIQPTVDLVNAQHASEGDMCAAEHVNHIAEANVRQTIDDIRTASPVLVNLEEQGKLKIVGAMYDVSNGVVTWL